MSAPVVTCSRHGENPGVYACHHLVAALHDRQPRGINRIADDDGTVTVWCDGCETALDAAEGAWTAEMQNHANINIICDACFADLTTFDRVKELE